MDVYITDENLNDIAVIDHANVIWGTKYNDVGEFELYAPASKELFALAQKGIFAYKEDSDSVMMLEKIQTKTDQETGDFITISGRGAESLLDRRIIWNQTNINEDAAQAAARIVLENLIEPTDATRKLSILSFGRVAPAQQITQRQLWGESLLDAVKELLSLADMGFCIKRKGKTLKLDLYKGADRSGAVSFCPEYDNLLRSEHICDRTEYKNTALVSGEGEGDVKKLNSVGTVTGIERREMYVEKGSTSTNEGTITEEDYLSILKGEGEAALTEKKVTETVNVEIEPKGVFRYGIEYNLGDIVTVRDDYENTKLVRIVQATENSDENGENLILSCENIK